MSAQAKLPNDMRTKTIAEMAVGEFFVTVPRAMWPDSAGNLWLSGDFTAGWAEGCTPMMRVERRADGYHVWAVPGQTYQAGGHASEGDIPVAELHR